MNSGVLRLWPWEYTNIKKQEKTKKPIQFSINKQEKRKKPIQFFDDCKYITSLERGSADYWTCSNIAYPSDGEGYRGVCGALLSLPTGKGLTSMTTWKITTTGDTRVEMGAHRHGFRDGLAKDPNGKHRNLGDHRSTYQVCALHTDSYNSWIEQAGADLHKGDCAIAWSPSDNYVRSWPEVHIKILD